MKRRRSQPRPRDTVQVIQTAGLDEGYVPPSAANLFPPNGEERWEVVALRDEDVERIAQRVADVLRERGWL